MSIFTGVDPQKSINLIPELILTLPLLYCPCAKQIALLMLWTNHSSFSLKKCLVHANKCKKESGNEVNKFYGKRNRNKVWKHQFKIKTVHNFVYIIPLQRIFIN